MKTERQNSLIKPTTENLLHQLGNPGKYQLLIYVCLLINVFPLAFSHLCMGLIGLSPPYYQCKNASGLVKDLKIVSYNSCSVIYEDFFGNRSETKCPNGWDYYYEGKEWTIVADWDLVCDSNYLVSLSTTIYFVGAMIGGPFFGSLSDRWGRRKSMLFTLYLTLGVGIAIYFSTNYTMFVLLRLIQGALAQGLQGITSIVSSEQFTSQKRTVTGMGMGTAWCIGIAFMAFLGYYLENWRLIQLVGMSVWCITIVYVYVMPESLRWLIANKKFDEAEQLVQKIATFNKINLSPEVMKWIRSISDETSDVIVNYGVFDLFKTPILRKHTIIMSFVWFANAWIYYGLSLSISEYEGNKYFNVMLGGLVEIPANIFFFFILIRYGRRLPLLVFYILGGIACIIAGFSDYFPEHYIDTGLLRTGLALFGRGAIGGCYTILFFYAAELFPTNIRNVALGFCLFWDPLGATIAPQILLLGNYTYKFVPIIIFGFMSATGGLLCGFMPETLNCHLPDTVEELEQHGLRKQSFKAKPKQKPSCYNNAAFENEFIVSTVSKQLSMQENSNNLNNFINLSKSDSKKKFLNENEFPLDNFNIETEVRESFTKL